MALASAAPPSPSRVLPLIFLGGWILLAAGEALGPVGAPAVPLCVATVAGLLLGSTAGFWGGFVVGLAGDLLAGLPLGVQAVAAAVVGGGLGSFSLSVSPGSWVAPIFFTCLVSIPYRFLVQFLSDLGGATIEGSLGLSEGLQAASWDVGLALLLYLLVGRTSAVRRNL